MHFNVVRLLFIGGTTQRIQLNADPVPCRGCDDAFGYAYAYMLPRHRNLHNLFVEAVLADGSVKYAGPAVLDAIPARFP